MPFIAASLIVYLFCFFLLSMLSIAEGASTINVKKVRSTQEAESSTQHLILIPLVPFSATRRRRWRQLSNSFSIKNNQSDDCSYSLSQLYRGYGKVSKRWKMKPFLYISLFLLYFTKIHCKETITKWFSTVALTFGFLKELIMLICGWDHQYHNGRQSLLIQAPLLLHFHVRDARDVDLVI